MDTGEIGRIILEPRFQPVWDAFNDTSWDTANQNPYILLLALRDKLVAEGECPPLPLADLSMM
ncbi:hypothetical protein BJX76DRAFT_331727, partial [Aspergillus varians]